MDLLNSSRKEMRLTKLQSMVSFCQPWLASELVHYLCYPANNHGNFVFLGDNLNARFRDVFAFFSNLIHCPTRPEAKKPFILVSFLEIS